MGNIKIINSMFSPAHGEMLYHAVVNGEEGMFTAKGIKESLKKPKHVDVFELVELARDLKVIAKDTNSIVNVNSNNGDGVGIDIVKLLGESINVCDCLDMLDSGSIDVDDIKITYRKLKGRVTA